MDFKGLFDQSGQGDGLIDQEKIAILLAHADECRRRFFKCLIPFILAFIVGMCYPEYIMRFLAVPLVNSLPKGASALHFTSPIDVVYVYIQVAFLAALLATTPIWVFQSWRFLANILGEREKRYVTPFIIATTVLFISGMAFCYYFMLPSTLNFLMNFGMEVATPMITMTDYVSLVTIFELSFGIVFELPVLMVILSMVGVVHASMLKKYRRITIVIILVIAAILTPSPDPISQMIMAVPMYVLFEAGILLVVWMEKNRRADQSLPVV